MVLSWEDITSEVFMIDGSNHTLSKIQLPDNIDSWTKWKLVSNNDVLMFERSDGNRTIRIGIDTGDNDGVLLNKENWDMWRAAQGSPEKSVLNGTKIRRF